MISCNGIKVNERTIALDSDSSETCFVSHAHADHTSAFFGKNKKREIIASEETFLLVGSAPQKHSVSGIELFPAGHMLGARQLRAETEGGVVVYTGDFALHDSYTTRAAPILSCDTLVIDSTYLSPSLIFPKRYDVMESMRKFVTSNSDSTIIFGAYVTGKSQELVKFLNRECRIAPVVNEKAAGVCGVYEKCGIKLDYISAGTPEGEEATRHPFVAIMPPRTVNFSFGAKLSETFGRKVKTAVATGWAASTRFPVDAAFPLSDHADFKDTMRYIYGSGAKRVFCANSREEEAASYLNFVGIDAAPLANADKGVQTTLATAGQR